MLVLSRNRESEICIGADITIKVLEIHKRHVKLGIQAPSMVAVRRREPADRKSQPTRCRATRLQES